MRTHTFIHTLLLSRQGLDASLVGVVPYAALRLGVYDALKWSWKKVGCSCNASASASKHIRFSGAQLFNKSLMMAIQ